MSVSQRQMLELLDAKAARDQKNCAVILGDSTPSGGNYQLSGDGSNVVYRADTVSISFGSAHNTPLAGIGRLVGCANENLRGDFVVRTRTSDNAAVLVANKPLNPFETADRADTTTNTVSWVVDSKINDRHWLALANAYAGDRIGRIYNFAVSGATSEHWTKYFDLAAAKKPSLAFLMGITNDARANRSSDQIISTLYAHCEKWLARDVRTILSTGTPFDSTAPSGYTAARLDVVLDVIDWIRQYATSRDGMTLFDSYAILRDPASATGDWRATYALTDKVHNSELGTQRAVNHSTLGLKKIIEALCPDVPKAPLSRRDDPFVSGATTTNLIRNPAMYGNATAAAGSAQGVVPDNWVGTGTTNACTFSVAARADGLCNEMIATLSGGNAQTVDFISEDADFKISTATAKTYEVKAAFRSTDLANVTSILLYLDCTIDGVTYAYSMKGPSGGTGNTPQADAFDGVFKTFVYLPAGGVVTLWRLRATVVVAAGGNTGVHALSAPSCKPVRV